MRSLTMPLPYTKLLLAPLFGLIGLTLVACSEKPNESSEAETTVVAATPAVEEEKIR